CLYTGTSGASQQDVPAAHDPRRTQRLRPRLLARRYRYPASEEIGASRLPFHDRGLATRVSTTLLVPPASGEGSPTVLSRTDTAFDQALSPASVRLRVPSTKVGVRARRKTG